MKILLYGGSYLLCLASIPFGLAARLFDVLGWFARLPAAGCLMLALVLADKIKKV